MVTNGGSVVVGSSSVTSVSVVVVRGRVVVVRAWVDTVADVVVRGRVSGASDGGTPSTDSVDDVVELAGVDPDPESDGFSWRYMTSSMATRTIASTTADTAQCRVAQLVGPRTGRSLYQPRSASFTSSLSISWPFMGSPSPRLTLARIWGSV